MKIKVLSIIFSVVSFVLLFIVPVSASVELPIDVNERYTDISYIDETNVYVAQYDVTTPIAEISDHFAPDSVI